MMKLSISRKIIFIAMISVVISSVVIFCISTILMGRLVTRTIYENMYTMRSMIAKIQQQEEKQLLQETQLLATMPQIINSLHEGDLETLEEIAVTTWLRLGLSAITFTDTNGITLVRGHSQVRGDDLRNRPSMAAALNGEISSGIYYESSALIPYAIRCYSPIYKDDVMVGAFTLGVDIGTENYIDNLQEISGMHFTLFEGNINYMTSLIDENGNRANQKKLLSEQMSETVLLRGETLIIQGEIFGEPNIIAYWPVIGYDGNILGMWAISKSLSHHNSETKNVLMLAVICSLGIILFFIVVASLLGRKIAKPIRKATEYAIQVAEGNLDNTLNVKSNDEVELLVGALKSMVVTLKERILAAEEASKAKSSFLSTISHEIRTPMNAILGITEIQLQNETLAPYLKEALEKIYTSGDMLLSIINDILDLSKIEAGKLELIIKKYDVASMVSDTAQLNMMRIGSKQIEFKLSIDENIPVSIEGDELRVKQILNNLLSNAFKYTASGKVVLSMNTEEGKNNEEIYLVISVSDTGQGMTTDQVAKLFDEYSRFNMEANRSTEGTGLGMSITRKLICLMNGSIRVESEPGKGSTFIVRLLQRKCDSKILGKDLVENLHQFRTQSRANMKRVQISREPMPYGSVLIVDDVDTNIYVAKGLLTPYNLKIETANSGMAAIEKIKNGKIYDIVFMDHMMPEMDGIEVTKRLREMKYEHPIVALTANAVSGQADIFLGNGFTDFISKPIDIRHMNVILNKLIRDKQPPEVIEAARRQIEQKKEQSSESKTDQSIDSRFQKMFVRDANKSLDALNAVFDKYKSDNFINEEDLQTYIIHTHGVKSVLTHIGNADLSAAAQKLEQSGLDKNFDILTSETPVFLQALKDYIDAVALEIKNNENNIIKEDEDTSFLHEKLLLIKTACEEYDETKAEKAITELREKTWSDSTDETLNNIDKNLLHCDFDEIIDIINKFLEIR